MLTKRGDIKVDNYKSANLFRASNGIHGERRYLIFAGWWRKWLDYVNFDYENREQKKHSRNSSLHNSFKSIKNQQKHDINPIQLKFRDELLQLKQKN